VAVGGVVEAVPEAPVEEAFGGDQLGRMRSDLLRTWARSRWNALRRSAPGRRLRVDLHGAEIPHGADTGATEDATPGVLTGNRQDPDHLDLGVFLSES
jgi:hypothetical protein